MNFKTLPFVLLLASIAWAQGAPSQAPAGTGAPGTRNQARSARREHMMEMHNQEMAAMKADVEELKSSLAEMKTKVAGISDAAEKARWQDNVKLWDTLVGHMDRMLQHMESMGPGMGGPPSPPPSEKNPD